MCRGNFGEISFCVKKTRKEFGKKKRFGKLDEA